MVLAVFVLRALARGLVAAALVLAAPSAASRAFAAAGPPVAAGPSVTTVAGDGSAGLRDGAASEAQFLGPAAIAAGPDGALYVADEPAQRIRKLQNGRVTTIAGSGALVATGLAVPGGYRDGPAAVAQFNEPTGIAVGADGTVYVADMLNRCIRRIRNGVVDTYAGNPARDGYADGPAATASFHSPHGVAIDPDGNLFVADQFGPVRTISPAGVVSTVALTPGVGINEFRAVATWGRGDARTLFATDGLFVHVYRAGKDSWIGTHMEGDQPFPLIYGVAAVDDGTMIVADPRDHVVRLYRHNDPPFVTTAFANAIAGTARENWAAAGFRDGPVAEAKFSYPRGVAVSNGTIYVADSGNRRIRAFPLPDLRRPVGNRFNELARDPNHYRIVYISSSRAMYMVDFAESLGGIVERGLNAQPAASAPPRPATVSVVRIDGAEPNAVDSLIDTYLSDGQADLVVLGIEPSAKRRGDETRARLGALQRKLRAVGTSLFVLVVPSPYSITSAEAPIAREEFASAPDGVNGVLHWLHDAPGPYDVSAWIELERREIDAVKSSGVPYYAAYDDFVAYERRPDHIPLHGPKDMHLSPAATRMLAESLLQRLAALRPWTQPKQR
ncbi:MAG TPA: hypothetical protein VGD01_19415 [Candidatus Elarobacter sp.]|jgi:hypothetical protein